MIKKIKIFIPLLVFVIVLIFLWRGLSLNPHELPSALLNEPVPVFEIPALVDQTKTLSNADLKGNVTLLHVWASWCYTCRAEQGFWLNLKAPKSLKIYGLDYRDQRTPALEYLKQYGNAYEKIGFDKTGQVGINFGVYGTPETFLIDSAGIIRYKYIGELRQDVWDGDFLPKIMQLQSESKNG